MSALKIASPPQPIPASFTASVFLAGHPAAPRGQGGWHDQALRLLEGAGYDGVVFVPEPRRPVEGPEADAQMAWEAEAQRHADAILFWIEEEAIDPITADQWGTWKRTGKAVFGAPPGARVRDQRWFASQKRVPAAATLEEAVQVVLPLLRPGALRRGGERAVPLLLWRSPAFQSWYRALRTTGNQLDDLEVEWSYRPRSAPGRPPLLWALRPRVWIRSERRHKAGEVVVGRADISATVLYHPAPQLLDTQVVLVREFRSAGQHKSGYVLSLPGGSAEMAAEREQDPRATAAREVEEETGLRLDPACLEPVGPGRQLASTILSHRAFVYRAALSTEQLASLALAEHGGVSHGANPGERCYVALRPLRQLLEGDELDWGQVGMILEAIQSSTGQRPDSGGA